MLVFWGMRGRRGQTRNLTYINCGLAPQIMGFDDVAVLELKG
ncbi:hypothetical protein TIFTF001_055857 [Ficus carica]|uniref:Uncharacterized protein n=1 Tax=Ficus carica TaxID=3494 RepID=A0AA88EAG1_FICCA|nr:hypothetical protein TIFTF001_055857 [Ficus carica]